MRILYIDIDTLRPDHLSCYGYHRQTSPNIDSLAKDGTRFENCYVSDAPCLPSRTSLWSGQFGFHTGVVNHGGINADMRLEGPNRAFKTRHGQNCWMSNLRKAGMKTVTFSPFGERHSAFYWYAGFNEIHNTGKSGHETADEIMPLAIDWLDENGKKDNWFLHVNVWDPHTPFRTPLSFGEPFANDPPPSWMTEELRKQHYESYGPHSAQDPESWGPCNTEKFPRMPATIASMADYKKWVDGYDTGIRYADEWVGKLLQKVRELGLYDDMVILLSSDHGENQGELNIYGDHHTSDHITSRVPLLMKGPGLPVNHVDRALHYQTDMAATVVEYVGQQVPKYWDGQSFLPALREGNEAGRPSLVVSQNAWMCQRGIRWDNWILLRTYDTGMKDFAPLMLFDVVADPHETKDLAAQRPDVVNEGLRILDQWVADMMATSSSPCDPLFETLKEGGCFHVRHRLESYCQRLRETGRAQHADRLMKEYANNPMQK